MKKLFFAALPFLIISCSEKSSEEDSNSNKTSFSQNFTVAITDTIMVDAGEEIIYMASQFRITDISDDRKWYYNYNEKENSIEVIHLDEAKLERKIHFEKEGPNGTGNVGYIDFAGPELLLINGNRLVQVFNSNGKKLKHLRLDNEHLEGDSLVDGEYVSLIGALSDDGQFYYSTYMKDFGEPLGIAIVDLTNQTLTKRPIEGIDAIKAFQIKYENGLEKMVISPSFYFSKKGNQVLMSNSVINELFVYDISKDETRHFTYESTFLKNKNAEPSRNEVNSQKELTVLFQKHRNKISLQQLIPDPTNKRYYRISSGENKGGNQNSKILTVFDEQFQQVFETDEIDYKGYMGACFVKEDKIYILENIEDELAFVIMEIKEI